MTGDVVPILSVSIPGVRSAWKRTIVAREALKEGNGVSVWPIAPEHA